MARRLALAAALLAAVWASPAYATTYYVSAAGSDSAAGTSQAAAWRTVGRVDDAALAPGDTVLFEGGSTFADKTLMPPASGRQGAPITFGSYGSGLATISNANGAVWFSGAAWLVFDHLRLTTGGSAGGVFAGSTGGGSTHIVLSNSVVENTAGIGVIAPSPGDADWTISGTTISHTGDSGVILLGAGHLVTHDTIADTGWNTAITWGKHGIYSKGPDQTISYNDISNDRNGQAVSIRFHGARVFGNTIHDTPAAFAFFDYDTGAAPQGTSYVYGNRAWNLTNYGFYYDGQLDPQGAAPSVDFVVASNTFQLAGASEAVNVSPSGSAHVTLANNVFSGTYGSGLRKAATTVEGHDLWSGGSSNVPSGNGDVLAAPSLTAAPDLAPQPGSPVVDAGTAGVGGLSYSGGCDGTPLSYCGPAPDLGAVETAVVPAPLAPPSTLVATAIGPSSLTLGWAASPDPRTTGYDVLRDGGALGTAALPTFAVSGLACGTTYTFSVRATGGGLSSTAAQTTVATAACPAAPPTTTVTTTTPTTTTPTTVATTTTSAPPPPTTTTTPTPTPVATTTTTPAPAPAPAPKPRKPSRRSLQTLPTSGASVRPTFVVAARAHAGVRGVTFLLDGRSACVDRRAPFSCALRARRGWHTVTVRALGQAATTLRLRVAG